MFPRNNLYGHVLNSGPRIVGEFGICGYLVQVTAMLGDGTAQGLSNHAATLTWRTVAPNPRFINNPLPHGPHGVCISISVQLIRVILPAFHCAYYYTWSSKHNWHFRYWEDLGNFENRRMISEPQVTDTSSMSKKACKQSQVSERERTSQNHEQGSKSIQS